MDELETQSTPDEREQIIDYTLARSDLTKRLPMAEIKRKYLITEYSAEELQELIGIYSSGSKAYRR
jgi:uncharacterized protein affecting Mg2+/Co2+ transport